MMVVEVMEQRRAPPAKSDRAAYQQVADLGTGEKRSVRAVVCPLTTV